MVRPTRTGGPARRPGIFVEPGPCNDCHTQVLLCRVAQVRVEDAAGITTAVLDGGINIAEALRNERHRIFPLRERPERPRRLHRLTGPTCTLGDVMAPGCELGALEVGDALAFMDAGAYCVPFSTSFSFPRPAVVAAHAGQALVLRRAETFEDIVSLDDDGDPFAGLQHTPTATASSPNVPTLPLRLRPT